MIDIHGGRAGVWCAAVDVRLFVWLRGGNQGRVMKFAQKDLHSTASQAQPMNDLFKILVW